LGAPDRSLTPDDLEIALLVRGQSRRCFQRLADDDVAALLGEGTQATEPEPA
jgi:hypothetical protein